MSDRVEFREKRFKEAKKEVYNNKECTLVIYAPNKHSINKHEVKTIENKEK